MQPSVSDIKDRQQRISWQGLAATEASGYVFNMVFRQFEGLVHVGVSVTAQASPTLLGHSWANVRSPSHAHWIRPGCQRQLSVFSMSEKSATLQIQHVLHSTTGSAIGWSYSSCHNCKRACSKATETAPEPALGTRSKGCSDLLEAYLGRGLQSHSCYVGKLHEKLLRSGKNLLLSQLLNVQLPCAKHVPEDPTPMTSDSTLPEVP